MTFPLSDVLPPIKRGHQSVSRLTTLSPSITVRNRNIELLLTLSNVPANIDHEVP